jgi:hypothetical protein
MFVPPKIGDTTYKYKDGVTAPGYIAQVLPEHSEDGRYWNVMVAWFPGNGNVHAGVHQYDAQNGFVWSTPPGPPWG